MKMWWSRPGPSVVALVLAWCLAYVELRGGAEGVDLAAVWGYAFDGVFGAPAEACEPLEGGVDA